MKPCITCGNDYEWSMCPGHLTPTGIEDHCNECCEAGLCESLEAEKRRSGDNQGLIERLEPCIPYVGGFPVSRNNF